jgi:hypothetical protein
MAENDDIPITLYLPMKGEVRAYNKEELLCEA